jgi:hypothetical protein
MAPSRSDYPVLTFNGVTLPVGPRIHLAPAFGLGLLDIASSLSNAAIPVQLSIDEAFLFLHSGTPAERKKFVIDAVAEEPNPAIPLAHRIRGFQVRFV